VDDGDNALLALGLAVGFDEGDILHLRGRLLDGEILHPVLVPKFPDDLLAQAVAAHEVDGRAHALLSLAKCVVFAQYVTGRDVINRNLDHTSSCSYAG
jgi:hypothetical protein